MIIIFVMATARIMRIKSKWGSIIRKGRHFIIDQLYSRIERKLYKHLHTQMIRKYDIF